MQYAEERQARRLIKMLARETASLSDGAALTIEGAGVRWTVAASVGTRSCAVTCFGSDGYIATFRDRGASLAEGRTRRAREVRAALVSWLKGDDIADIYAKHAFVDRALRHLQGIWRDTVQAYPDISAEVDIRIGQWCKLWFTRSARACALSFYGDSPFPTCSFLWDGTLIFELVAEPQVPVPLLVRRWVQDGAMPSTLRAELPWLDVGELAAYYEAGRGVEGEFVLSWDRIEEQYEWHPARDRIAAFLAQLRAAGFSRTLRAGQSLATLVLSRSRRYGLRIEQPCVAIEFSRDGMAVTADGGAKSVLSDDIALTPEIEGLLRELESHPID